MSREFGHFLRYYAGAPAIEQPTESRSAKDDNGKTRRDRRHREDGPHKAEEGYTRLFINLGKRDNFYAREIINLVNRYVRDSKIEIGRIDLTTNCSFFEVPDADAPLVLSKMKRAKVGERKVVVDHAERNNGTPNAPADKPKSRKERKPHTYAEVANPKQMKAGWKAEKKGRKGRKSNAEEYEVPRKHRKDDWRQFFEE